MELSLGLFFSNQGQIGHPLSEEISLLKCSSRSKQKILGIIPFLRILIINTESNYYVQLDFYIFHVLICVHDSIWILHLFDCESQKRLKEVV